MAEAGVLAAAEGEEGKGTVAVTAGAERAASASVVAAVAAEVALGHTPNDFRTCWTGSAHTRPCRTYMDYTNPRTYWAAAGGHC